MRDRAIGARLALLLAAALAFAACGAPSAEEKLSGWFSDAAPQTVAAGTAEEFLGGMGTVIGQKQTAGDVTATLDGALYDGQTMVLALTLSGGGLPQAQWDGWTRAASRKSWLEPPDFREKLRENTPALTEEEIGEYLNGVGLFGGFDSNLSKYIYDTGSGTARLLLYWKEEGIPDGREIQLHLEQVTCGQESGQEKTLKGPFDFVFSLDRQAAPLRYSGPVSLTTVSGLALTITDATVYAFGVVLDYTCAVPYTEGMPREMEIGCLRIGGEETSLGSSRGESARETDTGFQGALTGEGYPRAVDPVTVEAVEVGGTWLALSDFTLDQN